VLRSLIYLLADQQLSLTSHLRKKYDHAGKSLFEDANSWVALSDIFKNILQDTNLKTTYLVIDALDECVTDLPRLLDFIVYTSSICMGLIAHGHSLIYLVMSSVLHGSSNIETNMYRLQRDAILV